MPVHTTMHLYRLFPASCTSRQSRRLLHWSVPRFLGYLPLLG